MMVCTTPPSTSINVTTINPNSFNTRQIMYAAHIHTNTAIIAFIKYRFMTTSCAPCMLSELHSELGISKFTRRKINILYSMDLD